MRSEANRGTDKPKREAEIVRGAFNPKGERGLYRESYNKTGEKLKGESASKEKFDSEKIYCGSYI